MRVIALIELFMLAIANLVRIVVPGSADFYSPPPPQTLRRRLDPPKHTGPFFAWHDFRKPAFNVYILAGILNFLGLYTCALHALFRTTYRTANVDLLKVLIFIDLSATKVGISPEFSFYLLSIANAGSGLDRKSVV